MTLTQVFTNFNNLHIESHSQDQKKASKYTIFVLWPPHQYKFWQWPGQDLKEEMVITKESISWSPRNWLDTEGNIHFHSFSPIGSWSSRQYPLLAPSVRGPQTVWGCVCLCVYTGIVRNKLIYVKMTPQYILKFIPYTHTHQTIWGQGTDGVKSGHCHPQMVW